MFIHRNVRDRLKPRINVLLAAMLVLPLSAIGCTTANPSLSVPDAKSITIVCYCENRDLPPLTFSDLNAKQRTDVVNHLRNLSWTEAGKSLAEIGMIRPDIDILLTDKSDRLHTYQLYWTYDSLADQDSGLLLTVTDISKLRGEVTSITGLSSVPQPK